MTTGSRFTRGLATALTCALILGSFSSMVGAQPWRLPSNDEEVTHSAPDDSLLPDHWFSDGSVHKLLLADNDVETLTELYAREAVLQVFDYVNFRLVLIDAVAFGGNDALRASRLPVRDEFDLLAFNGYQVDSNRPAESLERLRPEERIGAADGTLPIEDGLFIVQFVGPVMDAWRAELESAGAEIIQYAPMNAYVVYVEADNVSSLASLGDLNYVQLVTPYQPAYKMKRVIREQARAAEEAHVPVTIQVLGGAAHANGAATVRALMQTVDVEVEFGPYLNLRGSVDSAQLHALARMSNVFAIEPLYVRAMSDERQGQIAAGELGSVGPLAPGYLSFLAGAGFNSSQFGSFAVNVVDDGVNLDGHPDLSSSRIAFENNPTSQSSSESGHGVLNSHIVGGFNDTQTGFPYEDADGYQFGLGIAPWAQVGVTAIFGSGSSSPTTWENTAYSQGARISTNSWNFQTFTGGPVPDYDSNSQEYDFLVRDARSTTAGNQQLMVCFSASNNGPQNNTVSTPASAKNVLTCGASENYRPTGGDGCGISNSGADDFNDIISFSSRGPVNSSGGDGRWKPEVVLPGTHIQAGVPQSSFVGGGVCDQYFPSGQTLYGWSSGTSHSTPAVAGTAALVYQWFLNQSLGAPSPAMIKAMLVNSCEYLNGVSANDTLPSNSQGMGSVNVGRAFDSVTQILVDQTQLLQSSGSNYSVNGVIGTSSLPLRVTLVWTDAPGPTTGAPYVNDLDLTVTVGGNTYRGNVFSGENSVTGGSSDIRNNTESVFLPAGLSGVFTVTVTGTSIGGDGVPGNGDSTDQDFALVVHNGSEDATPPAANFTGSPVSGEAPLNVAFSDSSTGAIATWAWTFGDGDVSGLASPSHVYDTPGLYTVALTVTGPGGADTLTRTDYISVTSPALPGDPTNLVAVAASDTLVDLAWDDNATNETNYEIERSLDGVAFSAIATLGAGATAYSDSGRTPDTEYWYRVRATNVTGPSDYSNVASVTTPAQPPVLANADVAGQGTVAGSYQDTHVQDGTAQNIRERLSGGKPSNRYSYLVHKWTFSTGGGNANLLLDAWRDANSDGDNFSFDWSSNDSNYTPITTVSWSTSQGALSFGLGSVPAGTIWIRVTDTDQTAGSQSLDRVYVDYIALQGAGVGGNPPSAATGLGATATSDTSIDLSWSDNSADEDGFRVERSLDGSSFSVAGSTAANATSFTDTSLAPGTLYVYRVIAFNSFGDGVSSNTASATTTGGTGGAANLATGETSIDGQLTGTYVDTQVSDGVRESVREASTGGPPSQRVTFLEHRWNFNVNAVSTEMRIRAFTSSSPDDVFLFQVATSVAGPYTTVHTVNSSSDAGIVAVPLVGYSGAVYIRVVDSDQTPGNSSRDTIFVDYLAIMSQ